MQQLLQGDRLLQGRIQICHSFISSPRAAAICFYPLLMGASVLFQTLQNGAVPLEVYPKYVIPYAPIAVSLLLGVLPMPLWQRLFSKADLLAGAAVSLAGMALVSGVFGGAAPPEGHIKGVLLALGAALLYSTVVIMNKKLSGVDAYSKTTVQLLSAGAG